MPNCSGSGLAMDGVDDFVAIAQRIGRIGWLASRQGVLTDHLLNWRQLWSSCRQQTTDRPDRPIKMKPNKQTSPKRHRRTVP